MQNSLLGNFCYLMHTQQTHNRLMHKQQTHTHTTRKTHNTHTHTRRHTHNTHTHTRAGMHTHNTQNSQHATHTHTHTHAHTRRHTHNTHTRAQAYTNTPTRKTPQAVWFPVVIVIPPRSSSHVPVARRSGIVQRNASGVIGLLTEHHASRQRNEKHSAGSCATPW